MLGAVSMTLRALLKVLPPSDEDVSTMWVPSDQMAYRVPSGVTVPVNPSLAPLSSRGSPGTAFTATGSDQVRPPSVECDTTSGEAVSVQRVQPTYSVPAGALLVEAATNTGLC